MCKFNIAIEPFLTLVTLCHVGSGKSLALLCATLGIYIRISIYFCFVNANGMSTAWQKHEQMTGSRTVTSTVVEPMVEVDDDIQALTKEEAKKVWGLGDSPAYEPVSATQDDFQPMKPSKMQRKRPRYFEDLDPTVKESDVEMAEPPSKNDINPMPFLPRATRIYYATRTYVERLYLFQRLTSHLNDF